MRRWAVALICAVSITAQAQIAMTPQMLMPSPLGIVIMVGQWIMQDKKRVYYIRVAGTGSSETEARTNGFRLAVEQAVGTLILSETETRNQRIVRDEIITYASGFVDRFDIVKTERSGNQYQVTMDVWVGESRIANRLLNQSIDAGSIDGPRLSVQVETLRHERVSGDRIVETVLRDFPRRAFDVELNSSNIKFDHNRTVVLDVTYTFRWNRTYYDSLVESFRASAVESAGCWWPSRSCTERQNQQFRFANLAFDDPHKLLAMIQQFHDRKPAVLMTVVNRHNHVLARDCQVLLFSNLDNQPYHMPSEWLFSVVNNTAWINTRMSIRGQFRTNLGNDSALLNSADSVRLQVVPVSECRR